MSLNSIIKDFVQPINSVITSSVFGLAALDFFAPKGPYLSWVGYAMAAPIIVFLIISALLKWHKKSTDYFGRKNALSKFFKLEDKKIITSSGCFVAIIITIGVILLGQASKAKAEQGGILASSIPAVATAQSDWLGLHKDSVEIKTAIENVSNRLEYIVENTQIQIDPLKELVARGYSINDFGLIKALDLHDKKSLSDFSAINYKAKSVQPLTNLLNKIGEDNSIYGSFDVKIFKIEVSNRDCFLSRWNTMSQDIDNSDKVFPVVLKLLRDVCSKNVVIERFKYELSQYEKMMANGLIDKQDEITNESYQMSKKALFLAKNL